MLQYSEDDQRKIDNTGLSLCPNENRRPGKNKITRISEIEEDKVFK